MIPRHLDSIVQPPFFLCISIVLFETHFGGPFRTRPCFSFYMKPWLFAMQLRLSIPLHPSIACVITLYQVLWWLRRPSFYYLTTQTRRKHLFEVCLPASYNAPSASLPMSAPSE